MANNFQQYRLRGYTAYACQWTGTMFKKNPELVLLNESLQFTRNDDGELELYVHGFCSVKVNIGDYVYLDHNCHVGVMSASDFEESYALINIEQEKEEREHSLRHFLLHETLVGDKVIFYDNGWRIGSTVIDDEDLFMQSLNDSMLRRRVTNHYYKDMIVGKDSVATQWLIVEIE